MPEWLQILFTLIGLGLLFTIADAITDVVVELKKLNRKG